MTILLYGFKNFGHYRKNVSEQVLKEVAKRPGLVKKIFKVEFSSAQFIRAVDKYRPDFIIGTGQCPGGKKLLVETVARNCYRKGKDVSPIIPGDAKALKVSFRFPKGKNVDTSRDAGTFICNYAMYLFESWARQQGSRTAFLHIPSDYSIDAAGEYLEQVLDKISS